MGAFCHLPRNSVHKKKCPPQHIPRDEVDCLHKTNVNWLGKLLLTLEYSWEDKELIGNSRPGLKLHCPSWIQDTTYGWTILSSTLAKTFLGMLRSVIPHDAGACSPVPLLEERNYHPGLPIQRHCLYLPKACCGCQSHNIQCLKKEWFNYHGDLTLVMAKLPPHPFMSMGLMWSLRYSFHCLCAELKFAAPTCTMHHLSIILLSPLELPDNLPEALWQPLIAIQHTLCLTPPLGGDTTRG